MPLQLPKLQRDWSDSNIPERGWDGDKGKSQMLTYCALLYLLPAFVFLLTTGRFARQDDEMTAAFLFLAAIPFLNVIFAFIGLGLFICDIFNKR